MQCKKIPIIVGVTGHRNIVEEDKPAIRAKVRESLVEIQQLCNPKNKNGETPVIMLNAFAQGADMLCAEVAFELKIPVYAVLPCPEEEYVKSFDDESAKAKLHEYLVQTQRQIIAPDAEQNREWLALDAESYRYRQLGIYVAEHSHVLLALWDGKPPKTQYGCGTVEVIQFALEHKFLDKDRLFIPGNINDSAVVWIKSRRQGDGTVADVQKRWLISNLANRGGQSGEEYVVSDYPPAFLREIIAQTVEYNSQSVASDVKVKLWNERDAEKLDDYRKCLDYHYAKADWLSYEKNQKYYNSFLLAIAILGTLVALTFLIYDDASLPYMIFPCTLLIGAILALSLVGKRRAFHKDYIKYRAFAEALRIQFYLSMCVTGEEVLVNVCDLYSWTQKVDMVWIDKAIQAIAVVTPSRKPKVELNEIIDAWIGRNETPKGQLRYHSNKLPQNKRKAKTFEKLSLAFQTVAIVIYFVIFLAEVVACIMHACQVDWFWEGCALGQLSWRNFTAIVLGVFTAGSLLLSSYWGKLSYDRKADDNEKMTAFYASAYARWQEVRERPDDLEKFVTEIAREEIVENGIWCSYVNENGLEINI